MKKANQTKTKTTQNQPNKKPQQTKQTHTKPPKTKQKQATKRPKQNRKGEMDQGRETETEGDFLTNYLSINARTSLPDPTTLTLALPEVLRHANVLYT